MNASKQKDFDKNQLNSENNYVFIIIHLTELNLEQKETKGGNIHAHCPTTQIHFT